MEFVVEGSGGVAGGFELALQLALAALQDGQFGRQDALVRLHQRALL